MSRFAFSFPLIAAVIACSSSKPTADAGPDVATDAAYDAVADTGPADAFSGLIIFFQYPMGARMVMTFTKK